MRLERCVRQGNQPDTPAILYQYLAVIERSFKRSDDVQRDIQRRSYHVLLDTVCDSCVAYPWRQLCLDNIHRPLNALSALAYSDEQRRQLLRMKREVYTLSQYFLAAGVASSSEQPVPLISQWQRS